MCNTSALVYFVKQLAWLHSTIARQGQVPFVTIKASTYALETLSHMTCMTERQVNVGQHAGFWQTNSNTTKTHQWVFTLHIKLTTALY